MNENIIAWNATNWVTVLLMAAIGFFVVGLALKWKTSKLGGKSSGTVNTTAGTVQP